MSDIADRGFANPVGTGLSSGDVLKVKPLDRDSGRRGNGQFEHEYKDKKRPKDDSTDSPDHETAQGPVVASTNPLPPHDDITLSNAARSALHDSAHESESIPELQMIADSTVPADGDLDAIHPSEHFNIVA